MKNKLLILLCFIISVSSLLATSQYTSMLTFSDSTSHDPSGSMDTDSHEQTDTPDTSEQGQSAPCTEDDSAIKNIVTSESSSLSPNSDSYTEKENRNAPTSSFSSADVSTTWDENDTGDTPTSEPTLSAEEYANLVATEEAELQAIESTVNAHNQQLQHSGYDILHYDGGQFHYPAGQRGVISSDYGYRTHPISGVQQLHNGIDYALSSDTPILAAYNGQVAGTGFSSVMGNYIVIYHGDGLYSIYMHASTVHVSSEQIIRTGDIIGTVGSTGLSTGNHLHFSIRINGSFVSPWNYL